MSNVPLHIEALVLQLERLENELEPRPNRTPPRPMLIRQQLRNMRALAKTIRDEYAAERGERPPVVARNISA